MQKLLRRSRSANPNCFFCNTDIKPPPSDPRNFQCPNCSCWNRYDARGVIISDEAAMHQEQMNMSSYALRASPSKNVIPAITPTNRFCQTCRTNQTLQMNLLANYLPPTSDPAYKQLLEQLPAYKESLNLRYPPLCPSCTPAVEEVLERKNQMARTSVLGGWLRQIKVECQRIARGGVETAGAVVVFDCGGKFVAKISGIWLAIRWDPTFAKIQKANLKGRQVRFVGRQSWESHQRQLWALRVIACCIYVWKGGNMNEVTAIAFLVLEISLLIVSVRSIDVTERIAPRIITSSSNRSQTPFSAPATAIPDTDPLAFLSLSSKPMPALRQLSQTIGVRASSLPAQTLSTPAYQNVQRSVSGSHQQPVFGQTSFMHSLLGPPSSSGATAVGGDDEMEWDPTYPRGRMIQQDNDEDDWIKPQRFFPREEPTGLEGLLESWNPLSEPGDQVKKTVLKGKAEALRHGESRFGKVWDWFGGGYDKGR
ncbi:hypothetical protein M407DRAFT_21577 [Tulasnella calospora MUT 4182]|uniref:Ima1 N-terminal domain-containing protein n=1 Tax=Tulasnella calospora MUT 4182 TaxID=1051891 RepID=A0A0C3M6V0_9AGAM|nr:hypothetical protein M407DRAFT_21577 [Tulasnella calospora MUT 4182]